MEFLWIIILLLLVLLCALAAYRYFYLRPKGTSIVMRHLPADGGHGWRHGVACYREGTLEFFQLRSLSRSADIRLDRMVTELKGRREVREEELHTLESFLKILIVESAGTTYELALDLRGETAFTSWLESAPTRTLERSNAVKAMKRVEKSHRGDNHRRHRR